MRIFFDTEFTGLKPGAALISIGLVDETGLHEFYAELTDTYEPADCSLFCQQEVLPQLQGGSARLSLAATREALATWLKQRGSEAVLVCDSPRDVVQLRELLPEGFPPNVRVHVLGWFGNLKRHVFNWRRRIHRQHGLRVHHALDDAKVNRLVLTR